jgi:hypothetical protein
MESNGARNRIHLSQETTSLLEAAGKLWTRPREDLVRAKGKGELQTFWLELSNEARRSRNGSTASSGGGSKSASASDLEDVNAVLTPRTKKAKVTQNRELEEKKERLVQWNTDVFCRLLKQVIARNRAADKAAITKARKEDSSMELMGKQAGATVIDEVVEIITLPELNVVAARA